MRTTSAVDLAKAIMTEMEKFQDATLEDIAEAVKDTATFAKQQVKLNIASAGIGGTKYKNSWRSKKDSSYKTGSGVIIYANENGYRIAHLLEHGHAKVSGGRTLGFVPGREHLAPAEAAAEEYLIKAIEKRVGGGN